ncbi:hypothetical protein LOZ03_003656 [Ophidiomyces ophidiicola]|uniref:uncharacterized protein n=1 Tax=Ophidiomyces ophidiicola TaxID=1387563 RepID=UPI0020C43102|nr:uncharacterized protein LOZ57_004048 [Ophidiomyces ophidiicola]KAI1945797.1 hypothetical protein LOZ57_004048 [Ophidiomyces ophidiicola]KAI2048253.1 hypothetical protein LOZ38_004425 [Ophidiomyces ophidiicola]KAI2050294.1 hypothetical protein LOZ43_004952 [Ophidiomyces ophidiicola]KAI2095027.1 hypothetical protein LOZ35_003427 [Ophidiomyces ophidiicola]KAI2184388.1 hypothetical protein LOZ21_004325 [Ophidiomyces ophidiicola]
MAKSKSTSGSDRASADAPEDLPANAEDRAAAVALSSLNTTTADTQPGVAPPSKADQEALGKAMSRLEVLTGKSNTEATADAKKDAGGIEKTSEEKVVKKPVVKVKAEDVNLLVDQLEFSKPKATELLKTHEGDPRKALRAFVSPPTIRHLPAFA